MFQSFEDLEVWKRACKLSVRIYEVLRECREFGLRNQMQRAAVSIASNVAVSQPQPFSQGQTTVVPTTQTNATEQKAGFKVVDEFPTIQQVASALNALGLTTRDMMAIFQSMKRAGALHADLILN